jgi:hypothetical protein
MFIAARSDSSGGKVWCESENGDEADAEMQTAAQTGVSTTFYHLYIFVLLRPVCFGQITRHRIRNRLREIRAINLATRKDTPGGGFNLAASVLRKP